MAIITKKLQIYGTVQGVWYRESMRQEAAQRGVNGWVRNCLDGSVEAVVQGTPDTVEQVIGWCRRGPERAVVTGVEIRDVSLEDVGVERFASFQKRPGA